MLALHQLHEILCSRWKGGAHLLHHGLHLLKVNAWVYSWPTLSALQRLQSHTHMSDRHRGAATEREQLYRHSRDQFACLRWKGGINSHISYLHLAGHSRAFQNQIIPVEMPLFFRTDTKQNKPSGLLQKTKKLIHFITWKIISYILWFNKI